MAVTLVQHRHKDSDHLLRTLLQERSTLRVCEVEDKMPIEHGHIYVAPPNYHLLIEPGYFSLSTDAPVRFSRPSIDVTFASAADSYAHRTVGIVLTGANDDGAEGLRRISDRGGFAIVQDPDTAESRDDAGGGAEGGAAGARDDARRDRRRSSRRCRPGCPSGRPREHRCDASARPRAGAARERRADWTGSLATAPWRSCSSTTGRRTCSRWRRSSSRSARR